MKHEPDTWYCPCGDAWWELTEAEHDQRIGVSLDETGRVIAYTGIPRCLSCGATFSPKPKLSVVK